MIGCWHAIPSDVTRHVRDSLGAHVGGCDLVVERRNGERAWHWRVITPHGHELECGIAPDATGAERLAEEAVFRVHPPSVGDWVERLL
jgi:hypothetical protein